MGGDGACVGKPAHAVAACRLEHRHRAHHVGARARHRVGAAERHLQRGEVDDRADSVRRHHPVEGLGVGDVALLPGDAVELFLREEQAGPAAIGGEIEGDGGNAGPHQDRERPAPDASARAGDEHRAVEVLAAGGESVGQ